ncbi:hypothetical protein CLV68_3131 [Actinokineospora cianjurensis]|uniref:Uncharacterized protein n=1 Tax=Actinokineospora cianjurensis TaxID=585224 RepID=A0A421B2P9_9PSEU|nr:hypothetical protein CLV68_3131 [Actinokineospora cianjurensis]
MCLSPIPAVAAALSTHGNPDEPPEQEPVGCELGASRVAEVAQARLTEPVRDVARTCCIA